MWKVWIRVVVFTLMFAGLADSCPLFTRTVTDDPGCNICQCCRSRGTNYTVLCNSRNLMTIPPLPRNVTYLNLENNPIHHLNDTSFPWLPHLGYLKLGNAGRPYQKPNFPLKSAQKNTFRNLPALYYLQLTLELETVNTFLSSIRNLIYLRIRCAKLMSQKEYRTLFAGMKLDTLITEECDFPLDEGTFEREPAIVQHTPNSAIKHINLPKTKVIYTYKTGKGPMAECLNMKLVKAEALHMYCLSHQLKITSESLDWVGETNTEVSLHVYAPNYQQLRLAKHTFPYLSIWTGPSYDQEQDCINDLMQSVSNITVGNKLLLRSLVAFPRYTVFSKSKLQKMIGGFVGELVLREYRIGRIDNFDFNITSFECQQCLIHCRNCFKASSLESFSTDDSRSTFLVNLDQVLSHHPKMTKLCLRAFKVSVSSFDLGYHPRIEHLEILSYLPVRISTYSQLNLTGLANLRYLSIRWLVFPTIQSMHFNFANLTKLHYLDISFNINLTVTGSLNNVFRGLVALSTLKLQRNPFWKSTDRKTSLERLALLLRPVAKTLTDLLLTENDIEDIPGDLFAEMHNLQYLSLFMNKISSLDGNLFRSNPYLTYIQLEQNLIETIDERTVEVLSKLKYLQRLLLAENRFRCVCANRAVRDWIKKDHTNTLQVIEYDAPCYGPNGYHSQGTKFTEYTIPWLDCDYHTEIVILSAILCLLMLLVASGIAMYYYRYDILFWWVVKRPHRVNRRSRIHPEKRFHAFLSYSGSEQELAEHIFRQLEEDDDVKFRIAYDCRDFRPGYTIDENIVCCIDRSEKVLFLISRRFLVRGWTIFELNFAQMRCFEERRNLIILIFVEPLQDNELPRRLRTLARQVNCLYYYNLQDGRAVQNFWHRLRIALAQDSELEPMQPRDTGQRSEEVNETSPLLMVSTHSTQLDTVMTSNTRE